MLLFCFSCYQQQLQICKCAVGGGANSCFFFIFCFYYCTESPFLQHPALQPLSVFQARLSGFSSPARHPSWVSEYSSAPSFWSCIFYPGFRPIPNYTTPAVGSELCPAFGFASECSSMSRHSSGVQATSSSSYFTFSSTACPPRLRNASLSSTFPVPPLHHESLSTSSGFFRTSHASCYCLCISNPGFKPIPNYTTTAACNDVCDAAGFPRLQPALITSLHHSSEFHVFDFYPEIFPS